MQKLKIIAIFIPAFLLINCKTTKIGYAETSVLMAEFTEAINARKQFESHQKEWDANLKVINDSLISAMNEMKAGYEKASAGQKEKMRTRLNKWNEDLNRYKAAVEKQSKEKEQELMSPVINKVNSFLKIWGEQNGYDLILGTMTGGNILHANTGLNITSNILKDLNDHYRGLPKAAPDDAAKKGEDQTDTTESE